MATFALVTAGFSLMLGSTALFFSFKANVWTTTESQRLDVVDRVVGQLHDDLGKMVGDLPESKLTETESLVRALKADFGKLVTEVEQHRAGVHRSMQRFDAIMRRDEEAVRRLDAAQADEGIDVDDDEPDRTPEEVEQILRDRQEGDRSAMAAGTLAAAHQAEPGSDPGSFRRELQRQYFANRGIAGRR